MIFPFVVGSERSGTTLLRSMLDSHPDLAIPWESGFIAWLGVRPNRFYQGQVFDTDKFLEALDNEPNFRSWGVPPEVMEQEFAPPPFDYAEAIRCVYRAYASAQGKARYGDKTPLYVRHLIWLANLFPEARFVHIVRDGRDVAASTIAAHFGPSDVASAAWKWRRDVTAGRSAGLKLGRQRYMEVRYEDLVEGPEKTLQKVCQFFDLTYDAAMLDHQTSARQWIEMHSSRHDVGYGPADRELLDGDHARLLMPVTQSLRNWKRDMSEDDLAVFNAVAGSALQLHGYPRPNGLSVRCRARGIRRALTLLTSSILSTSVHNMIHFSSVLKGRSSLPRVGLITLGLIPRKVSTPPRQFNPGKVGPSQASLYQSHQDRPDDE